MVSGYRIGQDSPRACRIHAVVAFVWTLSVLLGATSTQGPWTLDRTPEIVRSSGSNFRIAFYT